MCSRRRPATPGQPRGGAASRPRPLHRWPSRGRTRDHDGGAAAFAPRTESARPSRWQGEHPARALSAGFPAPIRCPDTTAATGDQLAAGTGARASCPGSFVIVNRSRRRPGRPAASGPPIVQPPPGADGPSRNAPAAAGSESRRRAALARSRRRFPCAGAFRAQEALIRSRMRDLIELPSATKR